jgi:hypothetical protein
MHAINRRCRSLSAAQFGPPEDALRGAKYAGSRLRTSAGAIAFAAGVVLALTATADAQTLSSSRQSGEPTASRLRVNDQRISVGVNHDNLRQDRALDSDLQRLYDDIMGRVGGSYPR